MHFESRYSYTLSIFKIFMYSILSNYIHISIFLSFYIKTHVKSYMNLFNFSSNIVRSCSHNQYMNQHFELDFPSGYALSHQRGMMIR